MNWKKALTLLLLTSAPVLTLTEDPTNWDDWCLAEAVYLESRGESDRGQQAVAQTILNRVNHQHFPNTICQVVFQKGQFSWTKNWKTWSFDHKTFVLSQQVKNNPIPFKALYFHNHTANPGWKYHYITQIDNHHFYK